MIAFYVTRRDVEFGRAEQLNLILPTRSCVTDRTASWLQGLVQGEDAYKLHGGPLHDHGSGRV